jgi:hypothetical protein
MDVTVSELETQWIKKYKYCKWTVKNGGTTDKQLHGTYYRNREASTDKTGYVPTWDNYEKLTRKFSKNERIE